MPRYFRSGALTISSNTQYTPRILEKSSGAEILSTGRPGVNATLRVRVRADLPVRRIEWYVASVLAGSNDVVSSDEEGVASVGIELGATRDTEVTVRVVYSDGSYQEHTLLPVDSAVSASMFNAFPAPLRAGSWDYCSIAMNNRCAISTTSGVYIGELGATGWSFSPLAVDPGDVQQLVLSGNGDHLVMRSASQGLMYARNVMGTWTAPAVISVGVGEPRAMAFNGDGTVLYTTAVDNDHYFTVYEHRRDPVTSAWLVASTEVRLDDCLLADVQQRLSSVVGYAATTLRGNVATFITDLGVASQFMCTEYRRTFAVSGCGVALWGLPTLTQSAGWLTQPWVDPATVPAVSPAGAVFLACYLEGGVRKIQVITDAATYRMQTGTDQSPTLLTAVSDNRLDYVQTEKLGATAWLGRPDGPYCTLDGYSVYASAADGQAYLIDASRDLNSFSPHDPLDLISKPSDSRIAHGVLWMTPDSMFRLSGTDAYAIARYARAVPFDTFWMYPYGASSLPAGTTHCYEYNRKNISGSFSSSNPNTVGAGTCVPSGTISQVSSTYGIVADFLTAGLPDVPFSLFIYIYGKLQDFTAWQSVDGTRFAGRFVQDAFGNYTITASPDQVGIIYTIAGVEATEYTTALADAGFLLEVRGITPQLADATARIAVSQGVLGVGTRIVIAGPITLSVSDVIAYLARHDIVPGGLPAVNATSIDYTELVSVPALVDAGEYTASIGDIGLASLVVGAYGTKNGVRPSAYNGRIVLGLPDVTTSSYRAVYVVAVFHGVEGDVVRGLYDQGISSHHFPLTETFSGGLDQFGGSKKNLLRGDIGPVQFAFGGRLNIVGMVGITQSSATMNPWLALNRPPLWADTGSYAYSDFTILEVVHVASSTLAPSVESYLYNKYKPVAPAGALKHWDFTTASVVDLIDGSTATLGGTPTAASLHLFGHDGYNCRGAVVPHPAGTSMDLYVVLRGTDADGQYVAWYDQTTGGLAGVAGGSGSSSSVTVGGYRCKGVDVAAGATRAQMLSAFGDTDTGCFIIHDLPASTGTSSEVFKYDFGTAYDWQGDLFEIILMPAGTARAEVRAYLSQKYNIST